MNHRRILLSYMSGPFDGKTLSWDIGDADEIVLTIGRRDGCDILLDYDSQVSRLHARIIYDALTDSYFLEDAGSRNGTFLGQDRLKERTYLSPGDLFRVGRTWLRIDSPAPQTETFDDDSEDDLPF